MQFDSPPAKMRMLDGQEGSVELKSSVGGQSSFKLSHLPLSLRSRCFKRSICFDSADYLTFSLNYFENFDLNLLDVLHWLLNETLSNPDRNFFLLEH
jgi:hypothetical protein